MVRSPEYKRRHEKRCIRERLVDVRVYQSNDVRVMQFHLYIRSIYHRYGVPTIPFTNKTYMREILPCPPAKKHTYSIYSEYGILVIYQLCAKRLNWQLELYP